MENFALGIAYGLSSATVFWAVGLVVRSIYRIFRSI